VDWKLEQVVIPVSDVDRAEAFYTDRAGFNLDVDHSGGDERGTEVSEIFHFDQGEQMSGPDPKRADYNSFLAFSDPDGNSWLVQAVKGR